MNKKIFIILIAVFTLLLASEGRAELPNNTFAEGEEVNVYVQCIMQNNSICDTTTNCTLTTVYPNTTLFVQDVEMTANNSNAFYNFSFGILTVEGLYQSSITCRGLEEGVIPYSFTVGDPEQTFEDVFWLYAFLLLVPLFLGITSWITEDKLFYIIAGFVLCTLAFLIFNDGLPGLDNNFITQAVVIIIAGLGFYLIAKFGYDIIIEEGFR